MHTMKQLTDNNVNVLFLTIKRVWFDKIVSGEKTIEYRDFKEYYHKRFRKDYDKIILQAGYSKKSPRLIADIEKIDTGIINIESEIFPSNQKVYRIHLKNVVEL